MIACMQKLPLACNIQSLFQPQGWFKFKVVLLSALSPDLNASIFFFVFFFWAIFLHYSFPVFVLQLKVVLHFKRTWRNRYIFFFVFLFTKYADVNVRNSISSIIASQGWRKRVGTALGVISHPRFCRNKKEKRRINRQSMTFNPPAPHLPKIFGSSSTSASLSVS